MYEFPIIQNVLLKFFLIIVTFKAKHLFKFVFITIRDFTKRTISFQQLRFEYNTQNIFIYFLVENVFRENITR